MLTFPVGFFTVSNSLLLFTPLPPSLPQNPKVMISIVEEHEEGLLFVLTMLPGDCSVFFLVLVL